MGVFMVYGDQVDGGLRRAGMRIRNVLSWLGLRGGVPVGQARTTQCEVPGQRNLYLEPELPVLDQNIEMIKWKTGTK